MKKKLLVFHKTIAPYRIDFFNSLNHAFDTLICPEMEHMVSQAFDYERLRLQFEFEPHYLLERYNIGVAKIPKGIISYIRKFSPDIIMVSEYGIITIIVIIYRWLFRKQYKIVSICDDSYNMVAENNDFKYSHKIARKMIAPIIDELILVEPNVVRWYQSKYGKGIWFPIIKSDHKARAMYNRLMPQSLRTMTEYNLTDKNVFLFVGRLVALKNVKTIIEAFSEIDQETNVLVIIGDGPEMSALQEQARFLHANILFMGRLEGDMLNLWYNIASYFVLASYREAFGAVTNEALLAGCWCLISNKAGSRCLIEEGVNGYTFNPQNVKELTSKMIYSTKLSKKETTNYRKSRMLEKFDNQMENLVKHLENI